MDTDRNSQNRAADKNLDNRAAGQDQAEKPKEIGGRKGPEPTRYGDWELNGKCVDF